MSSSLDPKDLLDIPDPFAGAADEAVAHRALEVPSLPAAPTRSRVRALRVGAVVAALACEAMLVAKMGLRSGPSLGTLVVVGGAVVPAAAAALAFGAVQGSASRKSRVVGVIALAALVFVATTVLTRGPGDDSVQGWMKCVVGTSMMIVGPALLALFSMRRAFATGAGWRTAALGVASGMLGAAATRLYCPSDALGHVLVGHGAPIAITAVALVVAGTRVTRA